MATTGNARPKVLLVATQDTKEEEARFLRRHLEDYGCDVVHLDASVRRTVGGAEISPEQIAEAAGQTIEKVRALGHEGKCLAVMIEGSVKLALEAHHREGLSGALALGGSMGTALAGIIFQQLPYGLPKLIVSTMASGFTTPYVGLKDIAMMNAVTDISGINSISREVYRNAAAAVAGMAAHYEPAANPEKPLVLIGTLGTTEKCVRRVRETLEADGFEVMVFHTSGAGGPTMDSIAADRDVAAVLDLSLTEMVDTLFGGLCAGGPDRGKAGLAKGVPTIIAPGNVDFIIGGPIEAAQQQFPGRRYHVHNPALTAVRTNLDDLKKIADHIAALAGEAKGPVQVLVPLGGFSNHDSDQGHIHEPDLPAPFADYLRSVLPANIVLETRACHFNDAEFADAIVAATRALVSEKPTT
jgi:uncharacterized protein (UPF0261 family)